ncbi:hypothetical protein BGZ83_011407, partial [Gryganskiella cystojenkinii]
VSAMSLVRTWHNTGSRTTSDENDASVMQLCIFLAHIYEIQWFGVCFALIKWTWYLYRCLTRKLAVVDLRLSLAGNVAGADPDDNGNGDPKHQRHRMTTSHTSSTVAAASAASAAFGSPSSADYARSSRYDTAANKATAAGFRVHRPIRSLADLWARLPVFTITPFVMAAILVRDGVMQCLCCGNSRRKRTPSRRAEDNNLQSGGLPNASHETWMEWSSICEEEIARSAQLSIDKKAKRPFDYGSANGVLLPHDGGRFERGDLESANTTIAANSTLSPVTRCSNHTTATMVGPSTPLPRLQSVATPMMGSEQLTFTLASKTGTVHGSDHIRETLDERFAYDISGRRIQFESDTWWYKIKAQVRCRANCLEDLGFCIGIPFVVFLLRFIIAVEGRSYEIYPNRGGCRISRGSAHADWAVVLVMEVVITLVALLGIIFAGLSLFQFCRQKGAFNINVKTLTPSPRVLQLYDVTKVVRHLLFLCVGLNAIFCFARVLHLAGLGDPNLIRSPSGRVRYDSSWLPSAPVPGRPSSPRMNKAEKAAAIAVAVGPSGGIPSLIQSGGLPINLTAARPASQLVTSRIDIRYDRVLEKLAAKKKKSKNVSSKLGKKNNAITVPRSTNISREISRSGADSSDNNNNDNNNNSNKNESVDEIEQCEIITMCSISLDGLIIHDDNEYDSMYQKMMTSEEFHPLAQTSATMTRLGLDPRTRRAPSRKGRRRSSVMRFANASSGMLTHSRQQSRIFHRRQSSRAAVASPYFHLVSSNNGDCIRPESDLYADEEDDHYSQVMGERPGSIIERIDVVSPEERAKKSRREAEDSPLRLAKEYNLKTFPAPDRKRGFDDWTFPEDKDVAAWDFGVVVSFGWFLPNDVITRFTKGGINVHPSLLPKYRGSAPLQRAIMNQDKLTGVTVQLLDPNEFDAGKILAQAEVNMPENSTYKSLEALLAKKGGELVVDVVNNFDERRRAAKTQDPTKVTKANKISRDACKIQWSKWEASRAERLHRANGFRYPCSALWRVQDSDKTLSVSLFDLYPVDKETVAGTDYLFEENETNQPSLETSEPGAIFFHKPTSSFHVRCANGSLLGIKALQIEGKKRVSAKDFYNGYKIRSGVSKFE